MIAIDTVHPAAWDREELLRDPSWIVEIDDRARADLLAAVRSHDPAVDPMSLAAKDAGTDLGSAAAPIGRVFAEAMRGRGIGLLRGLPRDGVSEAEFALMTWLIGLQVGVARPQGKASQYLSEVRDTGTVYRSVTGRGYSSNSELDFHVDGSDLVALTCYNDAPVGGQSLCSSALAAHEAIRRERPDLLELLYRPFTYNRQGEEAPNQPPTFDCPVFAEQDGEVFCTWVRNRVEAAQTRADVARLSAVEREALDYLDAVVRRDALMFRMNLRPGDMQVLNNHNMLHSRTSYDDHEDPARKRLLYRLWIAPAGSETLPASWADHFGSVRANSVRGGIRGQNYDARRRDFEHRQAERLGLQVDDVVLA